MHVHKLRVVTPARLSAVALVRAQVWSAVGERPEAVLQELEGDDVIVELSIRPVGLAACPTTSVARTVSAQSALLEVLGAWAEEADQPLGQRFPEQGPEQILDAQEAAADPMALRALLDDVPTAGWMRRDRRWRLYVPAMRPGRRPLVGVAEHRGYDRRFSAWDVRARRVALSAA